MRLPEAINIQIDYREKPSGIPDLLIKKGANVKFAAMSTGDYLINKEVCIERKTAEDFIQSLLTNRLFQQLSMLKKNAGRPLLLIEGHPCRTRHNISVQAVKGAMLSVSVSWQLPIVFSKDKTDSVTLLLITGQQLKKESPFISQANGYRPKKIKSRQQRLLQGLPGIGPKLANRLHAHFGNIRSVVNASEEAFVVVPGIGKRTAHNICRFVNGEKPTM